MHLYIVRHANTIWNDKNIFHGSKSNPGLSRKGIDQAKKLARIFSKTRISKIYTSPLLRASETARIISKRLGAKVIKKEGLKEIDLGRWEGYTPEQIDTLYNNAYKRWVKRGPSHFKIPDAETIGHFRERTKKTIMDIINTNQKKGNDILLVTHGGVIISFLSYMLNAKFDTLFSTLYIPNGSIIVFRFQDGKGCLLSLGRCEFDVMSNFRRR